jgi:hypothetical protein
MIEANYQRQQTQKKTVLMEDLNSDMQAVNDARKKLEGQLKRLGELEKHAGILFQRKRSINQK